MKPKGQYTIIIKSESAQRKLDSIKRGMGDYISKLIEKDIEIEELKKRIELLERDHGIYND